MLFLLFRYNRLLMSPDVSPVPFPATMAFTHIIVKAAISCLSLFIMTKPAFDAFNCNAAASRDYQSSPVQLIASAQSDSVGSWAQQGPSWSDGEADAVGQRTFVAWILHHFGVSRDLYLRMGAPAGAALALDIWLSGFALRYLPMSVYTACKSLSLVMTYAISLKLRLRGFRLSLLLCIFCISVGAFLVSFTSAHYSIIGLTAVMASAACSSCRWLLHHNCHFQAPLSLHLSSSD